MRKNQQLIVFIVISVVIASLITTFVIGTTVEIKSTVLRDNNANKTFIAIADGVPLTCFIKPKEAHHVCKPCTGGNNCWGYVGEYAGKISIDTPVNANWLCLTIE